jgi:glutaredoxin
MDKMIILYTMDGCPYCTQFKELLTKEGIEFHERDIDKHEEEYDIFSNIVENDFVPAVLVLEGDMEKPIPYMYAPERDYNELTEAVKLIKGHLNG